jgi:hypothetical protein
VSALKRGCSWSPGRAIGKSIHDEGLKEKWRAGALQLHDLLYLKLKLVFSADELEPFASAIMELLRRLVHRRFINNSSGFGGRQNIEARSCGNGNQLA